MPQSSKILTSPVSRRLLDELEAALCEASDLFENDPANVLRRDYNVMLILLDFAKAKGMRRYLVSQLYYHLADVRTLQHEFAMGKWEKK